MTEKPSKNPRGDEKGTLAFIESLKKYRSVLDDIPLMICSFLPGGEISFVNKAYCDCFSKTKDDLIGSNFLTLIPESNRQFVMDNISGLTMESPTMSHEHQVIAADGDVRWHRWTNLAIFDNQGQVAVYQATGEDITEQKQAEISLRESEALHRIILGSISDAVFITDHTGQFTYICPNVSTIFGYTYNEVVALANIEKLLGSNPIDRFQLENTGEIRNVEHIITDKTGSAHDVLINAKRVSIKGGTILYSCRDITDRKQTRKELMESEERYRQLFDNECDAVMIFDAENKQFEDANPATLELFGYSKPEFTQLTVMDISVEPEKTVTAIENMNKGIPGSNYIALRYFRKKSGKVFPGEVCSGSFFSSGRKKIIGAVRDITRRIRAENAVRKLSFRLLTAQEMERKRIATELHDDLGQALALLKLQLVNIQDNLPEDQDLKKQTAHSITYTTEIIKKIREISHGLSPDVLHNLGLTVSLKSLADDFSNYSKFDITCDLHDIDNALSPTAQITIYRIFQEILTNIEKHAHAEHVIIKAELYPKFVCFFIEDDGIGFEIENDDPGNLNETGLGLASIQERVQMLGGRFELYSQLNRGTWIRFSIPVSQSRG